MGSIEKLRTAARNMAKGMNLEEHEECNLLLIIADEIEREIAEKYVPKSDQVSELLNDFLGEYDASMRPDEEIIAKYTAKIREAMSQ